MTCREYIENYEIIKENGDMWQYFKDLKKRDPAQYEKGLNEWKNVGIIYHSTTYNNLVNILYDDYLESKIGRYPIIRQNKYSFSSIIWFSRNKNFGYNFRRTNNSSDIRFVVDGSKLSNNYEILPFRNTAFYEEIKNNFQVINMLRNELGMTLSDIDEQAEVIFDKDINNFITNYVQKIEIHFDIRRFIDFLDSLIKIKDKHYKGIYELNNALSSTFKVKMSEKIEDTLKLILNGSYNLTNIIQKIISIINDFYKLNIRQHNISKIEVIK